MNFKILEKSLSSPPTNNSDLPSAKVTYSLYKMIEYIFPKDIFKLERSSISLLETVNSVRT